MDLSCENAEYEKCLPEIYCLQTAFVFISFKKTNITIPVLAKTFIWKPAPRIQPPTLPFP